MSFRDAPRPTFHIILFVVVFLGAIVGIDQLSGGVVHEWVGREDIATRCFMLLMVFYIAQWFSYFLSVAHPIFQTQTLRLLLATHAAEPDLDTIREKGRSVLTTQAIFTAVSVFVISALYRSEGATPDPLSGWAGLSFYLILACAVLAVVFLILSADAVETTFNDFTPMVLHEQNVRYFYGISRRRKYYGFVLAVFSVILFVSRISPAVGCLAILAFLLAGYSHWFPRPSENKPRLAFFGYIAFLTGFVALGNYYMTSGHQAFG